MEEKVQWDAVEPVTELKRQWAVVLVAGPVVVVVVDQQKQWAVALVVVQVKNL